jgi:uncharacterized protein YggE
MYGKSSDAVKVTSIIVSTIVVLAVIALVIYLNARPEAIAPTIASNGVAQLKALPDLVSVYINVETNGSTTKEANDKNSEISDKVITELVKLGLERKDIGTENFNIYPQYDWTNGTQTLIGYQATHSIVVKLNASKIDRVSSIVDAAADAGAFISYINFELSQEKQNQYKADALKAATEDARIKAESIASGLDKKLGDIVSVSDMSFDYYPWPIYAKGDMLSATEANTGARSAVMNIQPGEQDISARVSVTYKII